jgi:hypothetical protein
MFQLFFFHFPFFSWFPVPSTVALRKSLVPLVLFSLFILLLQVLSFSLFLLLDVTDLRFSLAAAQMHPRSPRQNSSCTVKTGRLAGYMTLAELHA